MATPTGEYKTTFASNKETYQAALNSLYAGKPEDTETDLSKLLTPDFAQRDNVMTRDFDAFVAHIRWLREILPSVTLTVTQFLRDGAQLAERHSSETTTSDGTVLGTETFLFGEIAEDGRIRWIVETVKQKQ